MNAVTALLLLVITIGESQATAPSELVAEGGLTYSDRNGIVELQGGRGWLRIPHVYLDFRVAFDFRTTTPDTDGGVLVRTWVESGSPRGYRIRLPPSSNAFAAVVGRRQKVTVVEKGGITLRPSDEWQQVEVTAEGRRIAVAMNRTLVGVFEVETFGGHILFDIRKGQLQLRNIECSRIRDPERVPGDVVPQPQQDTKKAEEPSKPRSVPSLPVGLSLPKPIHEVRPNYTPEAARRQVEGFVVMELVVLPDGSVGPVEITRSLDPDLDLAAVAAVRGWRFKPGTRSGVPVPVLIEVEMSFSLKRN
jgi:TonB family protein